MIENGFYPLQYRQQKCYKIVFDFAIGLLGSWGKIGKVNVVYIPPPQ